MKRVRVFCCSPWVVALSSYLGACSGTIVPGSGAGYPGAAGEPGAIPPPVLPNRPSVDENGQPLPVSDLCKDEKKQFLPTRVWPLTGLQYENTVKRLFGLNTDSSGFSRPGLTNDGVSAFDTNAASAFIGPQTVTSLEQQSVQLAKSLLPLAKNRDTCLGNASIGRDCIEGVVDRWASLAFRRPLENDERKRFSDFAAASIATHGSDVGLRMFFEALLQSPRFLYRTELGSPVSAMDKTHRLSAHEIANQLSYMLTDNPPDAALLTDAAMDRLTDQTVLREHAARLLRDPGARGKVSRFLEQLYHLSPVIDGTIEKSTTAFPEWNESLRTSMVKETRAFLEHHLWQTEDALPGFFSADTSFLDARMATFYNLPKASLTDRAELHPLAGARRRGLMGHASLISAQSGNQATSPVHRGLFFFQSLLCQTVPTPPAGAAALAAKIVSPDPEATQKEHFIYAQKNAPDCSGCHSLFMPMGLSLEQFDAIGKYRETQYGKKLDVTVSVEYPESLAGAYADGFALADAIAQSEIGQQCFTRQYMAYALGRGLDLETDACTIEPVFRRFAAAGSVPANIALALVQDETFFFRDGSNL